MGREEDQLPQPGWMQAEVVEAKNVTQVGEHLLTLDTDGRAGGGTHSHSTEVRPDDSLACQVL